jgi:co-chaperonin GroES (HSP10)
MPRLEVKEVDVPGLIEKFPIIPFAARLFAVEKEVSRVGNLIVPQNSKEMQTNEGWVIAVGPDVDFCKPGDVIYYAKYSGAWCEIDDVKYRVMNEEDLLGKYDPMKEGMYVS